MNVLIVYHAGAAAGARAIYRALVKTGRIDLTVVVPAKVRTDRVYDPSGWLSIEREERVDGYRLLPAPLLNPLNYGDGFELGHLRRVIRDTQPAIIHVLDEPRSHYLFQVVWSKLLVSPRSRVLFYGFENRRSRLTFKSRVKWGLTWGRLAGGNAANNEVFENLRRAGFPMSRPLERIFWGIPTEIFRPMGDCGAQKKELGLDCEHIVGFVGRLIPEKGLSLLLASLQRLPSNVHCVVIGSGPMRAELELWGSLPGLKDRVHLYDVMPPEQIARYMNCMDVLAVPSFSVPQWKEQYGRVIAEAMACGVPVVGSDSGAIPEVIGSSGIVVPESNVVELARALARIISEPGVRAELGERSLRRAEEELSVDAMARRLAAFYERVLDA